MDELCNEIQVLSVQDTCPLVKVSADVRDIRPYIVCCILQNIDLKGENLKKFIATQVCFYCVSLVSLLYLYSIHVESVGVVPSVSLRVACTVDNIDT